MSNGSQDTQKEALRNDFSGRCVVDVPPPAAGSENCNTVPAGVCVCVCLTERPGDKRAQTAIFRYVARKSLKPQMSLIFCRRAWTS